MSNNRHKDERVSASYRSLANEKTPKHLDDKIMKMAAAKARQPRYARWMLWSRPLAWAATVTLCLAITLELSREPSLQPDLAAPASDTLLLDAKEAKTVSEPEASLADSDLRKLEQAPAEQGLGSVTTLKDKEQARDIPEVLAETYASEKTALGRSAARQPPATAAPAAPAARLRQSSDEAVEVRAEEAAAAVMMHAGAEADLVVEEIVVENECSDELQTEAESWLECILDLENAGNTEAAQRQRDALKEAFPDFKLP